MIIHYALLICLLKCTLGIACMSRQKFANSVPWATGELQSISLCPTPCWLVTRNWLQIFTFALKKQFHYEAVQTRFLKMITGSWSFIFQCL